MSCIQVTACWTHSKAANIPHTHGLSFPQCSSLNYAYRLPMNSPKWTINISKYQRYTPICLFGGKGKSENGSGASPWKALQDVVENLKSKSSSVENLLKQQIEKKEFYNPEGNSGNPPRGGDSGGGGGGGGGYSGTEDEGGGLEEALQVFFASLAFFFVYRLIVDWGGVTGSVVDYFGFIFQRKMTVRLEQHFDILQRLYRRMSRRRVVVVRDEHWLERQILSTTTWWDGPKRYERIISHLTAPQEPQPQSQALFNESYNAPQPQSQSQYDDYDDNDDDFDE